MRGKVPEQEVTHPLLTCPVCGDAITATVTVSVSLAALGVSEDLQHVEVNAKPTMERFHVTHHCPGRVVAADEPVVG